jgi:hypothetical protein
MLVVLYRVVSLPLLIGLVVLPPFLVPNRKSRKPRMNTYENTIAKSFRMNTYRIKKNTYTKGGVGGVPTVPRAKRLGRGGYDTRGYHRLSKPAAHVVGRERVSATLQRGPSNDRVLANHRDPCKPSQGTAALQGVIFAGLTAY